METRLGFIGLGVMGGAMAARLLEARYPLVVNNRTKSKANRLVSRGARFVDTPAEVVANSDVVLICVADTPDVVEIVRGTNGLLGSARLAQRANQTVAGLDVLCVGSNRQPKGFYRILRVTRCEQVHALLRVCLSGCCIGDIHGCL